jgi:hypothetical protein
MAYVVEARRQCSQGSEGLRNDKTVAPQTSVYQLHCVDESNWEPALNRAHESKWELTLMLANEAKWEQALKYAIG